MPFSKYGFQRGLDTLVGITFLILGMLFSTMYIGRILNSNAALARADAARTVESLVLMQKTDAERGAQLNERLATLEQRIQSLNEKITESTNSTLSLLSGGKKEKSSVSRDDSVLQKSKPQSER